MMFWTFFFYCPAGKLNTRWFSSTALVGKWLNTIDSSKLVIKRENWTVQGTGKASRGKSSNKWGTKQWKVTGRTPPKNKKKTKIYETPQWRRALWAGVGWWPCVFFCLFLGWVTSCWRKARHENKSERGRTKHEMRERVCLTLSVGVLAGGWVQRNQFDVLLGV